MMKFAYLCNKEKHQGEGCLGTACGYECDHTFLQEFAANHEAVEIAQKFATYFKVSAVVGDDVYFEEKGKENG